MWNRPSLTRSEMNFVAHFLIRTATSKASNLKSLIVRMLGLRYMNHLIMLLEKKKRHVIKFRLIKFVTQLEVPLAQD